MGALLYLHDGESFTAEKVSADRAVLNEEIRSPHLHSRNMGEIGATLEQATEALMDLQLVAVDVCNEPPVRGHEDRTGN